jgi:hypothetical protein
MTELQELEKQKMCHLQLQPLMNDIHRLMKIWFTNSDSDFNIEKNFIALQHKHDQYFLLVTEFTQSRLHTPSTLDDLASLVDGLAKEHTKIAQALGDVISADERFVYSLDTLIVGLNKEKTTLDQVVKQFAYNEIQPMLDTIRTDIQDWIDKVVYLKNFLLEANRKRSLLFQIVLDKLRLYLESQFAQVSGRELAEINNQVNAILAAADLLREIENWWFYTALLRGFGDSYLTKYLQYEKPLYIMQSQYAEGYSFYERIQTLDLPPNTHTFIVSLLQDYLNTLNSEIEKLMVSGWQPLLQRQIFLVEARERIIDRLSCKCKTMVDNYRKTVIHVQDLQEFRKAERLYKKVVDGCQENLSRRFYGG